MSVNIEDVSSVKKVLQIEVSEEQVIKEINKAYNKVKKTAKVKGFRPGKAPRSTLERLYKKDIHLDVSNQLIKDTFFDAIEETKLDIIGQPTFDPQELNPEGSFTYKAVVEVNPVITDIDFKGLNLNKTVYKISDDEINLQLKSLQKYLSQKEPLEEKRPAKEDDFALIDYEGFENGKPIEAMGKTENFILQIGKSKIHKNLDDGLIGMNSGETREIECHFPDDFSDKKLAGHDITIKVTLKEIRKEVLPEIDDEMAKKLGEYQNLEQLKDSIKKELEEGYSKRSEQEINEQIYKALLNKVDFEVPEILVKNEIERMILDTERSCGMKNMSLEDAGFTREGLEEKCKDTANKQVKRHLILNKIIGQEKLTLSDEKLNEGFTNMAAAIQQPEDEIKKFYTNNENSLAHFKHSLLEKEAINLIIENSVINEAEYKSESDTNQDNLT